MREVQIATIESVGFGLRDFPDGRPGLWFSVSWNEGIFGSLMAYPQDEAMQFVQREKIENVFDLNGRQCLIGIQDNIVHLLEIYPGTRVVDSISRIG